MGYIKKHCWQYDIRLKTKKEDLCFLESLGIEKDSLGVKDFSFQFEEKSLCYAEVREFIKKYEWLGKMSLQPTHIFTARHRGILAGVVVMDMPAAFSKLLGEDTRKMERLISRGACSSWTPKNLASSLVMFSIHWMVENTDYRLFTAYSDTEAKELGTIYQACNFYYLGKKSGARHQYELSEGRWVSDRYFRTRSAYKRSAKELGIPWEASWQKGNAVYFHLMPDGVEDKIKKHAQGKMVGLPKRELPLKHKYAYVLGGDKRETKNLRNLFLKRNKTLDYPKKRGY
jgi:hypothetical protein